MAWERAKTECVRGGAWVYTHVTAVLARSIDIQLKEKSDFTRGVNQMKHSSLFNLRLLNADL